MLLELGALELCRITFPEEAYPAIHDCADVAVHLEQSGYSRLWLSEHHTSDVAHSTPEILTAFLASRTERIRIGPGGILLRYYRAFKVAETFRLLGALYPDRIDLGLANGFPPVHIARLLDDGTQGEEGYAEKVVAVASYLRGRAEVIPNPPGVIAPELWVLGGKTAMPLAAEIGAAFCLNMFSSSGTIEAGRALIAEYRARFKRLHHNGEPRAAVALAGVCADTAERARRLAQSAPTFITPRIVGDPRHCGQVLKDISLSLRVETVIIADLCAVTRDRIRSYELIADVVRLPRPLLI